MRRMGLALMLCLALVSIGTPVSSVYAAVAIDCQGGGSHWSGDIKTAAGTNQVTLVRAGIDKQATTLCLNNGIIPDASADSSWVMIAQGASTSYDYIQHGFWNCAAWCNFGLPGGETGGAVHEFFEWNNGQWDGKHRVDLGSIGNGHYTIDVRYISSAPARFEMWRGGNLVGTVYDNGWRDWSLNGAQFQLYSESWDVGDQNGGTSSDKEVMDNAAWRLNAGNVTAVNMGTCSVNPSNHNGDYACTSFTSTTTYDSVRTWTNSR